MRQIIGLCNQLIPLTTKARVMKPFEAPSREVPNPHTWGEIALIKARMIADSWQPGKQVWVKVMYGRELLGEGKLNKGWYVGEDKSDVPQRATTRPECKDYELQNEPVEYIREREEIYGLEISIIRPAEVKTLAQIHNELQQAKERLWTAVENVFQMAMERSS